MMAGREIERAAQKNIVYSKLGFGKECGVVTIKGVDGHVFDLELPVGRRFSRHLDNILSRRVSVKEAAPSHNDPIENPQKKIQLLRTRTRVFKILR